MSDTFQPGEILGGVWEVEAPLGKGGMGSVYRCRNVDAPKIRAAIKLLDPTFKNHPEARARLLREAEILYTVDHPNVVRVSNVNLDEDRPYIEMEFVKGTSLELSLANEGPPPLDLALRRCRGLADALAYLHRKKIYHRDIKPENVLLDGDTMKLVDFGLATEANGRRITRQGQTQFGTVSYCPPEWAKAKGVEPGSWDCYAFGVLLYEMLTGTVAFPVSEGPYHMQTVQIMADKQRLSYLDPGPDFEPALRELVRRLTCREPESRLDQAKEIVRVIDELDPAWRPSTPVRSLTVEPVPVRSEVPVLAWGVGAVAVVTALVLFVSIGVVLLAILFVLLTG